MPPLGVVERHGGCVCSGSRGVKSLSILTGGVERRLDSSRHGHVGEVNAGLVKLASDSGWNSRFASQDDELGL